MEDCDDCSQYKNKSDPGDIRSKIIEITDDKRYKLKYKINLEPKLSFIEIGGKTLIANCYILTLDKDWNIFFEYDEKLCKNDDLIKKFNENKTVNLINLYNIIDNLTQITYGYNITLPNGNECHAKLENVDEKPKLIKIN